MLHTTRRGHGPAVVLVHGFTQTGPSWDPIAAPLAAAGFEVVTVDAPGHGRSGRVTAGLTEAADLLTAAGGPATYVGYSMGGRLCLHAALAHPEAVERLLVVGATGGIDDPADRAARRAADEALAAELEAAGDEGLGAFLERWLAGPLFATLPESARGLDARRANTAAGLASSLRLAGTGTQEPLWDRLGALTMPVLVVAGRLDAAFAEAGRRLVAAIGANARLELVAGAGHAVPAEQPDAFLEILLRFLRS